MIVVDDITMQYGARTLFQGVNVAFNEGHRYGLTGPNGAGKSTFMKILMGYITPNSGSIKRPEHVGQLQQSLEPFQNLTVLNTIMMGHKKLWETLEKRDALYEGEITEEVGFALAELEQKIIDYDGYEAPAVAEALLHEMDLGIDPNAIMSTLPQDVQFRILLGQALFGNPPALLLDEPTNHLDFYTIGWLESFLEKYKGTLVVTSHDRHFLNAVTTDIADIDYETIILYPGCNYDQMLETKNSARNRCEQENKNREKKISQLQEFVSKFSAGTRASQVQSRLKEIERLKPQKLKESNIQRPYIVFELCDKPGQIVFDLKNLTKAYETTLFSDFSAEIQRGEKVAIIGHNGRGKTTLLKTIAGLLTPDEGTVTQGHNVQCAYFPQLHEEIINATGPLTALQWLEQARTGVTEQAIRDVLGKMLFSGDDAFKQVTSLSGGEKARLILARIMLSEHNVLLLDEPNNHLDIEAVAALSWAITQYPGTVIMAAHDRDLLSATATQVLSFEKERLVWHKRTFTEWEEWKKNV